MTFRLRGGGKWHDGKPFTAKDVKCTWDLLTGKANEKLRINPRKSCYANLEDVIVKSDYEVTFRLKRPQPALIALLASGGRRSTPAMCRRETCAVIRSAPVRSNPSNSSRTSRSS